MAKPVELYTTPGCPYSAAAREDLEWRGVDFVEYDVEQDRGAYERMETTRANVANYRNRFLFDLASTDGKHCSEGFRQSETVSERCVLGNSEDPKKTWREEVRSARPQPSVR
jgi:glutaredoxin